jgi:hypothetical protein
MGEFQKTAIGLLGMSHPEIYRHRDASAQPASSSAEPGHSTVQTPALELTPGSKPTRATALRALKFALAALLAGARSIPLGDNGRVTQELSEYGAHLKSC